MSAGNGPRLGITHRHWLVDSAVNGIEVVWTEHMAEDRRSKGFDVSGPYVYEAAALEGAVDLLREIREPIEDVYQDSGNWKDLRAVRRRIDGFLNTLASPRKEQT